MLTIRPATIADASAIARVHVASWKETYAGIVPGDFLANLKVERREAMWKEALTEGGARSSGIFVAVTATGEVVGFASGGENRTPELGFTGELYAIYLLKRYQGHGDGKRLFQAVTTELSRDGHVSMMLWVLEDNRTVDFYKRLGGVPSGSKVEEIGGKSLNELALGWSKLVAVALP